MLAGVDLDNEKLGATFCWVLILSLAKLTGVGFGPKMSDSQESKQDPNPEVPPLFDDGFKVKL